MATSVTAPLRPTGHSARSAAFSSAPLLLTPLVLCVHGYHPFAGDAGIYIAGLRHLLDPTLYPVNAAFVSAFTRWSLFAWTMAAFLRLTHLPLAWALLLAHLASIALYLLACRQLAVRLFASAAARWCALLLAAAACALPVAGTALVLMDPYLTARSFSTPLSLFAVAAVLDRAWLRTAFLLALATALHPLMGACAAAFVVLQALLAAERNRAALALCAAAIAAAAVACCCALRLPVDPAYRQAVLLPAHTFLFLARWRWYEDLGLLLPLLLFAAAARTLRPADPRRALCRAALTLGLTSVCIAALFVRPSGPALLVPLQVLRSFHLLYAIGVVLAAGPIAARARRSRTAALLFFALLFAGMSLTEQLTWPGARRIEAPGLPAANPYQQAFLWIRGHTPRGAVFAFNPRMVYEPGEDEQGFRAIAERDHLADDKDAGIVAVLPHLAAPWARQRNAELNLDTMSGEQRRALRALGATWLLLPANAHTNGACPFRNSVALVCELQP